MYDVLKDGIQISNSLFMADRFLLFDHNILPTCLLILHNVLSRASHNFDKAGCSFNVSKISGIIL